MGTTTSNFNLIKPAKEDFYDIADQNSNMDIIDGELKSLKDAADTSKASIDKLQADTVLNSSSIKNISELISSGAVQTPKLAMGVNKVAIPDVPVSPRIEFTGMSYVNLLGKDGNGENINSWSTSNITLSTNNSNKVSGASGFKLTLQGNGGGISKSKESLNLENTKYYMISVYLKNGNATDIYIWCQGSKTGSRAVIDSTKYTRVLVKLSPTQVTSLTYITIGLDGTNGMYGYADDIMINEISASDYNLTDAELMAKYPYIESYAVLTNPYFENRRYNLVRNGNCEEGIGYWESSDSNSTLTLENDKFKLITTAPYSWRRQRIKVKRNTNYYFKANISGNGLTCVIDTIETNIVCYENASFNSGNATEVCILLHGGGSAGITYFDHIMLIEGTSAPTEYKSCDLQKFVVEGQFTQDDKVVIENGKVSGELNWKHEVLYGENYICAFDDDKAGWKLIRAGGLSKKAINNSEILIKYDGKKCKNSSYSSFTGGDFSYSYFAEYGTVYISVSDTDSGWTETVNPNNDEVTAFMNGWRAGTHNGTRYTGWVSVVDNTIPSSLVVTAAYGTNAGGQNKLNVVDSTKFAVNDWIYFVGDDKWVNTCQISAISGNQLTLTYNLTSNVSSANPIAKQDQTQIAWVKSNIAPNYKGYQIHYKLANPEPVADSNVHVQGDIWGLVKGDNYVYVDSGMICDEIILPNYNETLRFNNTYPNYMNAGSLTKYQAEDVFNVYNNQQYCLITKNINNYAWGKYSFDINTTYNPDAIYTVDYQILKTLHAESFGSLAMSYKQSIASTLESHSKELEQKQNKDSTLDTLIDLSIYESTYGERWFYNGRANKFGTNVYAYGYFNIFPKKVTPVITAKNVGLSYNNDMGGSVSIPQSDISIGVCYVAGGQIKIAIAYTGKDTVVENNLLNNGYSLYHDGIIADCRGRV